MNLSNDEAVKKLKKKIFCRIVIKYALIVLLFTFTVVLIIGAIFQQIVAVIGYVGILVIMFLIMRYPFKKISLNDLSQNYYETILKLLADKDKISNWFYIERMYLLFPEIDKLLYKNEIKEEYYYKNLCMLQSVLKNKRNVILSNKDGVSIICKRLYEDYSNKENTVTIYDIEDILKQTVQKQTKSFIRGREFEIIISVVLFVYMIFKVVVTVWFYEWIDKKFLMKFMYNVGADLVALVGAVLNMFNKDD